MSAFGGVAGRMMDVVRAGAGRNGCWSKVGLTSIYRRVRRLIDIGANDWSRAIPIETLATPLLP
jgi:hypothetical protein